uniref:DNA topoisomerase n=1 Tax=viral metagenome TaxID=1070528 RepID=A0A6C0B710_9ZZZZ
MPPKFYKKKTFSKSSAPLANKINYSATFLIIVESPSKCKKIEGFLGSDYCCIASKGHIRTVNGVKSIDTKGTFEPTFSIIDEKTAHVEFMHEVIGRFSKSNIILASDDDREGEAIAWHICKVFELPVETTQRIVFHEVTESALIKAVGRPGRINMNVVQAQHARQVLDILVGYKISPYLWKYLYHNKSNSLSAGRCQTPALRLVYDNEKGKKAFELKYKTIGKFFSKNVSFDLNKEFDDNTLVLEFMEKSKGFVYELTVGSAKESRRSAPKPFTTSRLLQTASSILHISPKETMSLCQQLYQEGHITYMRTESAKYSGVFIEQCKNYILKFSSANSLGNLEVLENKDLNNPHEAIRITNVSVTSITTDNVRLSSMYKLIWRNSVESCMADALYNIVTVKITAPLDTYYSTNIESPKFLGWRAIEEKLDINELQNVASSQILYFDCIEKSKKPFSHNYVESSCVARNKGQRYTEATLIHKLEELGIGRPSTFATIVDTIQERGYVNRTDIQGDKITCKDYILRENVLEIKESEKTFGSEKNKLVLQPIGLLTIEFLTKHFENIFEYGYTKTMEDKLDDVAKGSEKDWSAICKACYQEITNLSKPLAKLEKQTYKLDNENVFIFERYGPVIRKTLGDGTFQYSQVKKDINIDLELIKTGRYSVDDLIEIKTGLLGKHDGQDVMLKNGKYGPYVEYGDKRESVKLIDKPLDEITIDDVMPLFEKEDKPEKSVLRKIDETMSLRRGKFGNYVFYKTEAMVKPEFFNIKKFNQCPITCDADILIQWLKDKYIDKLKK